MKCGVFPFFVITSPFFHLYSTVSVQKNTYIDRYGMSLIWKYSETSDNGVLFPLNDYLSDRPEV